MDEKTHALLRLYKSGIRYDETRAANAAYVLERTARDPEKVRATNRRVARERRQKVIDHYGGECACCGESRFEFMAIDHVAGGGSKQRRDGVRNIAAWIVANDFPEGFRVLCHNCNQALGSYGECPHQREKRGPSEQS